MSNQRRSSAEFYTNRSAQEGATFTMLSIGLGDLTTEYGEIGNHEAPLTEESKQAYMDLWDRYHKLLEPLREDVEKNNTKPHPMVPFLMALGMLGIECSVCSSRAHLGSILNVWDDMSMNVLGDNDFERELVHFVTDVMEIVRERFDSDELSQWFDSEEAYAHYMAKQLEDHGRPVCQHLQDGYIVPRGGPIDGDLAAILEQMFGDEGQLGTGITQYPN
jgi:hypothetical protein